MLLQPAERHRTTTPGPGAQATPPGPRTRTRTRTRGRHSAAPGPRTRNTGTHRPQGTVFTPPPAAQGSPQFLRAATALLTELPRHASQLVLSEEDVARLAPAVATWFERGSTPAALRKALTDDLPQPVKYPAKFVGHRLTKLLPPPPTLAMPAVGLQNCDSCNRAFRSPFPGNCRDCAADAADQPSAAHLE